MPSLKPGDIAPDFSRPDHNGTLVRLSAFRGRWVVVFFYPKAHTPACTAEACSFRDAHVRFTAAGAVVIGVSSDGLPKLRDFHDKYTLPYALVSDDGSIRKAWGVPKFLGLFAGRVTYVIDRDGRVRHVFIGNMNVGKHVAEALAIVASEVDDEGTRV
ncbi:MAG: peroxiredoxin [Phycisphaerales bacterium]